MTKYVECWGADKPFANITDSKMAKNIGLAVSNSFWNWCEYEKLSFSLNSQSIAMIESNLLPVESYCAECQCWGAPRELQPVTMWYRNKARETMYRSQPEPTFRFDLICATVMFTSIALIQLIVFKKLVKFHFIHLSLTRTGHFQFPPLSATENWKCLSLDP